jgi:hypothetical protein
MAGEPKHHERVGEAWAIGDGRLANDGTGGMLRRRRENDGNVYVLSFNHIFASDADNAGAGG